MKEFEPMDEQQFLQSLEEVRVLPLTKYEALYLSDSMTLMLEHTSEKGRVEIPARGLMSNASVGVSIELIQRTGLAVLYATDVKNKTGMAELVVSLSELYLIRECCQSYVTHGNEPVGYNLIRKIYKLILQKELESRAEFEKILSDVDVDLEQAPPRVEKPEEPKNADTRTNNDRRSD
jgi:hypothetical protein